MPGVKSGADCLQACSCGNHGDEVERRSTLAKSPPPDQQSGEVDWVRRRWYRIWISRLAETIAGGYRRGLTCSAVRTDTENFGGDDRGSQARGSF
ncbi:hypothetical protein HPP92_006473 [Vanilla planifolia]|uniref:Uncharacterized protein n=1 Tax=Vanilla planifolia TaxID=51239 RepID=A0A835RKG8_VANPL|nr:hypothetical protein HPP92_006734 [Vanilla planifolia]KAG0489610.1 hypothetical protein HPP92_006473 [Vanilla planifolia]